MPEWTHCVCDMCYDLYWEERKWVETPQRVKDDYNWCCFCRDGTDSGIYVRVNPIELRCADLHTEEAQKQLREVWKDA